MANNPSLNARDLVNLRRKLLGSSPAADPAPPEAKDDVLDRLAPAAAPTGEDAPDFGPAPDAPAPAARNGHAAAPAGAPAGEADGLRAENEELRGLLQEMKQLLEEASRHDPELLERQIAELQQQLAEKDDV